MRTYLVKTPRLLKVAYANCIWHVKEHANSVYLTFDDGPHPTITPFVLNELKKYQAKATFFCIGKNVELYPEIYQQILDEGHSVGNHTQNHLNGWKTENIEYYKNIKMASKLIDTRLFRPPYGRITYAQSMGLSRLFPKSKIIMWDVLSGDFDTALTGENCLQNVVLATQAGSIIVFHDSEKAWARLKFTLPLFLEHCKQQGWKMKKL
ncbi:MAG TPA: polysaccharide deacetylase family protein [Chitinophagaceae bacterium]|jgi:peptidoglycan/xylan/chitin deacetylase (PgdA/CDA1 family)|nr:polysaccharide deacetylase family protein [Chitinophagaceae bacterium]